MSFFVVVREWNSDFDKKSTNWYNLFTTLDYEKAVEFLENYENDCETDLHLCKVPLDVEIDFIGWKQYILKTKNY